MYFRSNFVLWWLQKPRLFSKKKKINAELDHKFLIVMNKVDQFDNVADFARAYGALCWNLSKVVKRKDIPRIYTVFTPGGEEDGDRVKRALDNSLPVKEFEKMQQEVVREVLRAPARQLDNMMTVLEQTTHKVFLTAKIGEELRQQYTSTRRTFRAAYSLTALAGAGLALTSSSTALMMAGPVAAMVVAGAGELGTQKYLEKCEERLINSVDNVLLRFTPEASNEVCGKK